MPVDSPRLQRDCPPPSVVRFHRGSAHFCPRACTRPCREQLFVPGKSPISLTPMLAVCLAWVSASLLQSLDAPQVHHSLFQPFPGLSGDTGTCKPTRGLLPAPNTSFVKPLESPAS